MAKHVSPVCLLVALALLPTVASAQDSEGMPAVSELEPNVWSKLAPGGDTICATGTPYGFFVRPADPDMLLIVLGGGGMCWSFETCDLSAALTYQPYAGTVADVAYLGGVFDADNPENPFADYSMVFLPACTADNHLGRRETTYRSDSSGGEAQARTIFHNGYANAMAALGWTYANFDRPTRVFVLGISAGAVASPLYGGLVAGQYPDAHIVVLGDSAGGFRLGAAQEAILDAWGTVEILPDWPECEGLSAESLSLEGLFVASATRFPDVVFAQYNSADDYSQVMFLNMLGIGDISLSELLEASHSGIRDAAHGNFVSYTAAGTAHIMTTRSQFFALEENGVRLVDWVASLARGDAVDDVPRPGS